MYLHSKTCTDCNTSKPTSDFYKGTAKCKPCYGERRKIWKKLNKDKAKQYDRKWALKKHYGLSELDFRSMIDQQQGLCAICKQEKTMCVDHCHSTNKIRGLLCKSCNLGLGSFADDAERLQAAIEYLNAHKEKPC